MRLTDEEMATSSNVNVLKTEYPAWKQKFFAIGRSPDESSLTQSSVRLVRPQLLILILGSFRKIN
jgi:hypothetical protein